MSIVPKIYPSILKYKPLPNIVGEVSFLYISTSTQYVLKVIVTNTCY